MSFLYPQFLFALAALAIPLIIHLFNFRRYKRILFTNVSILKDIETSSRSVKNLKNLLILLSRLLGISFLVFAFAQPIITSSEGLNQSTSDRIVIFVDNSLSSEFFENGKRQLDWHIKSGLEIVKKRGKENTYHILSNDFKQSEMNGLSYEDALAALEALDISPKSRGFNEIVNRIEALSEGSDIGNIHAYILSDFQKNQFDFKNVKSDSSTTFNFVKLESEKHSNLAIDSCWMINPSPTLEGKDSLGIRIMNYSQIAVEKQMLRIYVNEKQVWMQSFNIPASGQVDIYAPIDHNEFGFYRGKIELSDNGLGFDNEIHYSYALDSAPDVYYLGPEKYVLPLQSVFREPFNFSWDLSTNVNVSRLRESNCIIYACSDVLSTGLIDAIMQQVSNGASLVFFPTDSSITTGFDQLLKNLSAGNIVGYDTSQQSITSLNLSAPLFTSVVQKLPENPNLPSVSGYFQINSSSSTGSEDILLINDWPGLQRIGKGNGNVYIFSYDLDIDKSSMVKHSIFVPIMLNVAFAGNKRYALYHYLANDELVEIDKNSGNEEVFHLIGEDVDIIPEIKRLSNGISLQFDDQLRSTGTYEIRSGGEIIRNVAFNFNRAESDVNMLSKDEIVELISKNPEINISLHSGNYEDVISSLDRSVKHQSLWKYCIILALIFFISEALIIKFIKV